MPIVPSVAMKAKASGIPAKFAATPEKVVSIPRIHRGVPSRIAAYAIATPSAPPTSAVTMLTSMLFLNAVRYGSSKSFWMLSKLQPPSCVWNAPTITVPAGRSRNAVV